MRLSQNSLLVCRSIDSRPVVAIQWQKKMERMKTKSSSKCLVTCYQLFFDHLSLRYRTLTKLKMIFRKSRSIVFQYRKPLVFKENLELSLTGHPVPSLVPSHSNAGQSVSMRMGMLGAGITPWD